MSKKESEQKQELATQLEGPSTSSETSHQVNKETAEKEVEFYTKALKGKQEKLIKLLVETVSTEHQEVASLMKEHHEHQNVESLMKARCLAREAFDKYQEIESLVKKHSDVSIELSKEFVSTQYEEMLGMIYTAPNPWVKDDASSHIDQLGTENTHDNHEVKFTGDNPPEHH